MILYVNGCSHTAAAEAVNAHAFAEDDGQLNYLGRLPHPANLAVSWGQVLANGLKMGFKCDAESAASNDRILRTTQAWIKTNRASLSKTLMIIQWTTWERQEWLIDGTYYQVNASGIDSVPESHRDQYRQFVMSVDWATVAQQWHNIIWQFHLELQEQNIQHVFFNGNSAFELIPETKRHDWGITYVDPYNPQTTYNQWLLSHNYQTVAPDSWHFGREGHAAWANFMLQYIVKNSII
jgi:hypothetical protein